MTSTVGGGTITGAIGTAQTSASSSAASSTYTFSPKANGTSLTYTPTAAFVGTMAITAKQILPISTFSYVGKDSTGAISYQALFQTLGSLNDVFEGGGGAYNTTGYSNTAQGANALQNNTTGYYNSAQGFNALKNNTTGYSNTAQGINALYSNTTGLYNSAQGISALSSNTTGFYNSAQGANALSSNTTGYYNSSQGTSALYGNISGYYNSAQGTNALYGNISGYYNSAQGTNALYGNTTGSYNAAQGTGAGYTATPANANVSGSNDVFIGYNSGPGSTTQVSNAIAIGSTALVLASNTAVIGNSSITDVYFGSTTPSAVIHATDFVPASSAPSISGCSGATIVGNDFYGVVTAGGVSCNAVLTFSYSALHGWSCQVNNQTHPGATNLVGQASSGVKSSTWAGTTVANDLLNYNCGPY